MIRHLHIFLIWVVYIYLYTMSSEIKSYKIDLPDANLLYFPNFLLEKVADELFTKLLTTLHWEQHNIKLFGKTIAQPRLTALYSSTNVNYSYSGLQLQPHPYTDELKNLNTLITQITKANFTHCLANLYRDGNDSMGWHSDNEKELGKEPLIASISLGAVRNFQLKHIKNPELKQSMFLEHGSLLIMKGSTQEFWKHQLPKSKKINDPRINLTFRTIF